MIKRDVKGYIGRPMAEYMTQSIKDVNKWKY